MKQLSMLLLISSLMITGCQTMKESLVVGVGSGAATGFVAGSMSAQGKSSGRKMQQAGRGALIGAAIGGLASYLIHGSLEKRDSETRRNALLNLDKFSVSNPSNSTEVKDFGLSAPDVDKECFDWEVKGNRLVQKHCVWTINGNSGWVPYKK